MKNPHQSQVTAKQQSFAQAAREWREMPSTYVSTRIVGRVPALIFHEDDPFESRKMYDHLFLNVCLTMETDFGARFPIYRGIDPAALPRILRHGIDVYPTNSPLWAGSLEKALEYGRGESGQMVLVLDRKKVRVSFASISGAGSAEAIASTEVEFGSQYDSMPDGGRYYSRWPKGNQNRNLAYEGEHGYYVPGEPFDAIVGLLYFRKENAAR